MNNNKLESLYKAFLSLKSVSELRAFSRDLCTLEELKEMAERWEIARLLNKGMTYREVAKKLNVSTTTVARVAFWLNNGEGGYKIALRKSARHHTSSFEKRL